MSSQEYTYSKLDTLELAESSEDEYKPVLPAEHATPTEVRQFLYGLLKQTRRLDEAHAHRIADCWTLGTGRELRQYQAKMYRHLFGLEEDWIVFRDVQVLVYMEERERLKSQPKDRTLLYWVLGLGAILFAALLILFVKYDPYNNGQSLSFGFAVAISVLSGGPFMACVLAMVLPAPPLKDVGTAVDNDLRTEYWKADE